VGLILRSPIGLVIKARIRNLIAVFSNHGIGAKCYPTGSGSTGSYPELHEPSAVLIRKLLIE
jgi:hypothetical protein